MKVLPAEVLFGEVLELVGNNFGVSASVHRLGFSIYLIGPLGYLFVFDLDGCLLTQKCIVLVGITVDMAFTVRNKVAGLRSWACKGLPSISCVTDKNVDF
jgi:hypothetical protein